MTIFILCLLSTLWYEDWTNAGIDELLIRTKEKPTVFTGTVPLGRGELSHFLNNVNPVTTPELWLKGKLENELDNYERFEYSAGIISDSFTREAILIGKGVHTSFLTVFVEPMAKFNASNEYPTNLWQDFVGCEYLKGYIKLSGFGTAVTLGREPIKWGPSPRNTLLLSGNAPPFDMVKLNYSNSRFKFSFLGTLLDSLLGCNRYLTGHRLEYKIGNPLYLGFSEIALFGGKNKLPDLYYFNPVFIYYPYQWNRPSEVNILWSMDFKLLLNQIGIYGEFLIDDTPYSETEVGDRPKIGINTGLQWVIGKNYFLAEYTNVTRWTYDHLHPWQQYTYLGYEIGHPSGPDFDETFLGINHHFSKSVDFLLDYTLFRKGEGTINEPYPVLPNHFPSDYWLTGDLKYQNKIELGIQIHKTFTVSCKAGYIISEGNNTPVFSVFLHNISKAIL
ncbi:MAG: capsule assembly Wzi family protein [bacterium]|nr:capsule assembly Wzi family protein [bacterium]